MPEEEHQHSPSDEGEWDALRQGSRREKSVDSAARPVITQDLVQRFADAFGHFVATLQEMWGDEELQRQLADVYRECVSTTQQPPTVPDDARDRVVRAYSAMLRSMLEAAPPFALRPPAAEPYREYMEALSAAATTSIERGRAAQRDCITAFQEAPDFLQTRADAAYATYLDELRRAWSEIDAGALPPEALNAIGQSIAAAAAARAASLQAVGRARLAVGAIGAAGA
jgi:hypothetical protein